MGAVKLDNFGGMQPAVDDRLLPDKAAGHSENTWLYSGRLSGIPQPTLVKALTAGTAKVFRIPNNFADFEHLDDSTWMEFADPDTNVIRALVIDDTFNRYYWASAALEPRYNTLARIQAGLLHWKLGIPRNTKPTLTAVGGTSVTATATSPGVVTWTAHGLDDGDEVYFTGTTVPEPLVPNTVYFVRKQNANSFWVALTSGGAKIDFTTTGSAVLGYPNSEPVLRAYVTTWVSAYGEEGPVSPAVLVSGRQTDVWTLTIPAASATDRGGENGDDRYLATTRIYRTVTSVTGVATFYLVDEIPITTLSFVDEESDDDIASNNILESTNWTAPPSDLEGITAMPNGILAGWRANELWFSEPYRPHAWPAAYVIVVDYPIVGLGVTNQTLVVCTEGYPFTASGIHPASIALSISPSLEPCLSRGSILSTTEGVYYASPNGLVYAGLGRIENITRTLLTKDKWQSLTQVQTLRAARFGTAYYAFGGTQSGVFDPLSFDPLSFALDNYEGSYGGVLVDPADPRIGFNLLSYTTPVTAVQNDPWSGEIFIIKSDNLYRIALEALDPTRRVYKWRSKVFQVPKPGNLAAMKVFWKIPTSAPDATADAPTVDSAVEFPELPDGSTYGVVRLYANEDLVWTRNLVTSGELMRLPSGYKSDVFQLEFETYVSIYSFQIATSSKELARA